MTDAERLPVKRTAKLFIGGKFPRSESGRSFEVLAPNGRSLGHAAQASRKDLRDATRDSQTYQNTTDRCERFDWRDIPSFHAFVDFDLFPKLIMKRQRGSKRSIDLSLIK